MSERKKKYRLLKNQTRTSHNGLPLYRIQAVVDIPLFNIKAGDIGGFIASEACLSHMGNCWVFDSAAVVSGHVEGDARISESACVDGATVSDSAIVSGNASVRDHAVVFEDAIISGSASVFGHAKIYGVALVCDSAWVYDKALIYDMASVCNEAKVGGNAHVFESAVVGGLAQMRGNVRCSASIMIEGDVTYDGDTLINDALLAPTSPSFAL